MAWTVSVTASARPAGIPTATRAAVPAASNVPNPAGARAAIWAPTVIAVVTMAAAGEIGQPTHRADCHMTADSSTHAARAPIATTGPGMRMLPSPSRLPY